jgi:hypothetical protein
VEIEGKVAADLLLGLTAIHSPKHLGNGAFSVEERALHNSFEQALPGVGEYALR